MAIISDYFNGRTLYPNQYIRIEKIETDKNQMRIDVGVHISQEYSINTPPHAIESLMCEFDLYSNKNLWEQAYVRIKQKWIEHVDA